MRKRSSVPYAELRHILPTITLRLHDRSDDDSRVASFHHTENACYHVFSIIFPLTSITVLSFAHVEAVVETFWVLLLIRCMGVPQTIGVLQSSHRYVLIRSKA
jgi:hypothetical protein